VASAVQGSQLRCPEDAALDGGNPISRNPSWRPRRQGLSRKPEMIVGGRWGHGASKI
jgi:hypothetical protein